MPACRPIEEPQPVVGRSQTEQFHWEELKTIEASSSHTEHQTVKLSSQYSVCKKRSGSFKPAGPRAEPSANLHPLQPEWPTPLQLPGVGASYRAVSL